MQASGWKDCSEAHLRAGVQTMNQRMPFEKTGSHENLKLAGMAMAIGVVIGLPVGYHVNSGFTRGERIWLYAVHNTVAIFILRMIRLSGCRRGDSTIERRSLGDRTSALGLCRYSKIPADESVFSSCLPAWTIRSQLYKCAASDAFRNLDRNSLLPHLEAAIPDKTVVRVGGRP